MRVLVTGGAGYIGSHTCLELLAAGHDVFVVDNLHNGHVEALEQVQRLSNRRLDFRELDIRDSDALAKVFETFKPETVIHFAALKAVGESVEQPLQYYDNNVYGSVRLLEVMDRAGCKKIVFSSSATVYGNPEYLPYDENHPLRPVNPYGRTKLMVEEILRDWASRGGGRQATVLRYFNPVGAHPSGQIGEDPLGTPNNLMPFISQVAVGRRDKLRVFGNDYDTRDGTGLRDYIHVVDLARAHVASIEKQADLEQFEAINIGTGSGSTVLEVVEAFERVTRTKVAYEFVERRPGDLGSCWADASRAEERLGWRADHALEEMCEDTWRWQSLFPKGYDAQ